MSTSATTSSDAVERGGGEREWKGRREGKEGRREGEERIRKERRGNERE